MSKRYGHAFEAQFVADALLNDLDVAKPEGDFLPYDLLVTNNGGQTFQRVQVKGTTKAQVDRPNTTRFKIQAVRSPGLIISATEVDVLAVYCAPVRAWYHIPATKLKARSIALTPTRASRSQYEVWKDAWNVYHAK